MMVVDTEKLLEEAKKLSPEKRAELIEGLLASFDSEERKRIDDAWAKEAESRLQLYKAGLTEAIPVSKVFEEIDRMDLQ